MSEFEELGMIHAAEKHKKWLESPEMKAKFDSGDLDLKPAGPKELQPSYLH